MVDTFQPRSLSSFRNRKRRHDNKMNLQKEETPRALQHDMGWRARRTFSLLPVAGETFLLTLPFIERAYRKGGYRDQDAWKLPWRLPRLKKQQAPNASSEPIRGCADLPVARMNCLLRHHLVRELAHYHIAYLTAFLSRFNHGVARAVMLGGDGCRFGIELIQCRPVRK